MFMLLKQLIYSKKELHLKTYKEYTSYGMVKREENKSFETNSRDSSSWVEKGVYSVRKLKQIEKE